MRSTISVHTAKYRAYFHLILSFAEGCRFSHNLGKSDIVRQTEVGNGVLRSLSEGRYGIQTISMGVRGRIELSGVHIWFKELLRDYTSQVVFTFRNIYSAVAGIVTTLRHLRKQ